MGGYLLIDKSYMSPHFQMAFIGGSKTYIVAVKKCIWKFASHACRFSSFIIFTRMAIVEF